MSFRQDKAIISRKARKCEWCDEALLAGSHQVRTSGACGDSGWNSWGAYWRSYLHPECWRAEREFWKKYGNDDYNWMETTWMRGALAEPGEKNAIFFSDAPVSTDEVKGVLNAA